MTRSVLAAITQAAVGATGARRGWLLRLEGGDLVVVAAGGEGAGEAIGLTVPGDRGTAGFAVASGQPLAAVTRPGDDHFAIGVADALGVHAGSVLCVPCGTDEGVVGALEVIDKQAGGAFSIDDVELVTLLGTIAGAALSDADRETAAPDVPPPEQLAVELRRLAVADTSRYWLVATALSALLAHG